MPELIAMIITFSLVFLFGMWLGYELRKIKVAK